MAESQAGRPRLPAIEELGPALLGTGDFMIVVGYCWTMCWYAAQGGNVDLAAYYLRRVRALLRRLAGTKPKYRDQIAAFDREHLDPVYEALQTRDLRDFAARYTRAVDQANLYHVETGHPYIVWSLPQEPPASGLDLGPGAST